MLSCIFDPGPCISGMAAGALDFALGFLTLQVLVAMLAGAVIGARFGWAGVAGLALAVLARANKDTADPHEHVPASSRDAAPPARKPKPRAKTIFDRFLPR